MKNMICLLFVLGSWAFTSHAETTYLVSASPAIVGELYLSFSDNGQEAQVMRTTGEKYPTWIVSRGPIRIVDFDSEIGTERIVLVGGSSELHFKEKDGTFRKVQELHYEKLNPSDRHPLKVKVAPGTNSIEIRDGHQNVVFRTATAIGDGSLFDQREQAVFTQATEDGGTIVFGWLPDGIYKMVVGLHVAKNKSEALIAIKNGRVSSLLQVGTGAYTGDFTITNGCGDDLR